MIPPLLEGEGPGVWCKYAKSPSFTHPHPPFGHLPPQAGEGDLCSALSMGHLLFVGGGIFSTASEFFLVIGNLAHKVLAVLVQLAGTHAADLGEGL